MLVRETLGVLVTARLTEAVTAAVTAAAGDILMLFDRTIAELEKELFLRRLRGLEDRGVQVPSLSPGPCHGLDLGPGLALSPGPGLKQEVPESPQIKEEPEEQSRVKLEEEQLPVPVPESSAACLKTEDSSLLTQRQTDSPDRERSPDLQTSDTDDDDDWEPFTSPAEKSTGLLPKSTSSANPISSVNPEDATGAEEAAVKKHQCSVCGKRFRRRQHLKRHNLIHTGGDRKYPHHEEKKHHCPLCSKSFTRQGLLIVHQRVHTGERPFSCAFCMKSFSLKGNLERHVRIHTGEEKTYQCSVCHRSFSSKQYLQKHSIVHTGERPFGCSHCGKTFAMHHQLKYHVTTRHTAN